MATNEPTSDSCLSRQPRPALRRRSWLRPVLEPQPREGSRAPYAPGENLDALSRKLGIEIYPWRSSDS